MEELLTVLYFAFFLLIPYIFFYIYVFILDSVFITFVRYCKSSQT